EPIEALAEAGPEVEPERLVLAGEPAAADAQRQPASGEVIERHSELGGEPGVAERVRGDEQAEPGAGRERCEGRQGGPALQLRVVPVALVRQQVVVEPEAVEACPLGGER